MGGISEWTSTSESFMEKIWAGQVSIQALHRIPFPFEIDYNLLTVCVAFGINVA